MQQAYRPRLLSRYREFPFRIEAVELFFRLDPEVSGVRSRIWFAPKETGAALELDGGDYAVRYAALNGILLDVDRWRRPDGGLTIPAEALPIGPFVLETHVVLEPDLNTDLVGLYLSNGVFCTQCEPEGFRRITFFPDRPDVLARFRVRIETDAPVALSNGNLVESGPGWVVWEDPVPKPAYLFALVAGPLAGVGDRFVTRSGREIELAVWVRPGPDEERCGHALLALKRAMAFDEETFGLEYDLEVYNMVAIDDFNMMAMENKGLAIFNARHLLVSPKIATDEEFAAVEGIVAHEYFHNWTGNRIPCRDWFHLCIKEGITVFREQEFRARWHRGGGERIREATLIRTRQFREDTGPLAHPVRPTSYYEISNFYTATVYEKAAEVVRMLRLLVGPRAFAEGFRRFIDANDGRGVTLEDWLQPFEEVSGRDLRQFRLWYTQAGTPIVTADEVWRDGRLTLIFRQNTMPTPGQPVKRPLHIPILFGLMGRDGRDLVGTRLVELREAEQTFEIGEVSERPVPSLLRAFSAPVFLRRVSGREERAFRLEHDSCPYAKWDAGRMLARDILCEMIVDGRMPGRMCLDALHHVIEDERMHPEVRALTLMQPSEQDIAQTLHELGRTPDPLRVYTIRRRLQQHIARQVEGRMRALYRRLEEDAPYSPSHLQAGRRALRLALLTYLSRLDGGETAQALFGSATNMTEMQGALVCLLQNGRGKAELDQFYRRFAHDRLAIDKWFALQVRHASPHETTRIVQRLAGHPAFSLRSPNRFRALFGSFAANAAGFHAIDGEGYRLMANWILEVDRLNPQIAAAMLRAFESWVRFDAERQGMMREAMEEIASSASISRPVRDMVGRMLTLP